MIDAPVKIAAKSSIGDTFVTEVMKEGVGKSEEWETKEEKIGSG
jgi:hypothetical protein